MKPLGMTAGFQIVTPSRAQDKIYEAVEAAIEENCTPERFIKEAWECWGICLKEKENDANRAFENALPDQKRHRLNIGQCAAQVVECDCRRCRPELQDAPAKIDGASA